MHDAVARVVERVKDEVYLSSVSVVYYLLCDLTVHGPYKKFLDDELTPQQWEEHLEFALALLDEDGWFRTALEQRRLAIRMGR